MSQKSSVVPANIPPPARQIASILQHLFKIPRSQIPFLLENGHVTVNGRARRQGFQVLDVGDSISVDIVPQAITAPRKSLRSKEPNRVIDFLYDDADIVIVNKPANLLTVPTKHREAHTLLSLVERQLKKSDETAKLFCVHRLDRGVSGVLVLAKSLEVAEALRDQFALRKPNRRYIALVVGTPSPPNNVLRNYLSTDADLNRYVVQSAEQGELAITHYLTRQVWRDSSLLEIKLETGRRNQIRVQLAEIGHPILGDPRYRARLATHWAWPHARIALHAESLGFTHPRSNEPIDFETPWPQEFRDFIRLQKKNLAE
ncbi:MAG: RluA family pseudouridine synthase [Pirellula sp.]